MHFLFLSFFFHNQEKYLRHYKKKKKKKKTYVYINFVEHEINDGASGLSTG